MNTIPAAIFRCVFVVAAIVAAYYSALFARASFLFRQNTPASVANAAELVPYNALYVARLAVSEPEKKIALLHRAVELNPFDVNSWVQLGLTAEMEQRDIPAAERYYLRAWKVDHMFLPRWTLTNFYFRQHNAREFFHWGEATLQITPYPADPVFAQMWLISQDARQIAQHVPDRAGILMQYASFLANAHQYGAVAPIVHRLVAAVGNRNPIDYGRDDQIGPTEDRLLAAGDLTSALDIWKSMSEAKWIALPIPTPTHPLNNGDFQIAFFRHGFDWIPVSSPGVTIDQITAEKSLRITFSGTEPDHCVLFEQYVPLDADQPYRLDWQANAQGVNSPSGLAWHLYPLPSSETNLAAGDLLSSAQKSWDFTSPRATNLCLLTLEYTRRLGTVRPSGDVTLHSVSLEKR